MLDLRSLWRAVAPHPQPQLPTPNPSPRGGGGRQRAAPSPSPLVGEGRGGGAAGPKPTRGLTRRPPLSLHQGRHGANRTDGPGVILALRHPVSIVGVIARKGKAQATSEAMEKHFGLPCPPAGESRSSDAMTLHWCGFEQWYAVADGFADGALYEDLRDRLAGLASVADQSHGRIILHLEGPKARDLLAKGTGLDLHPRVFGPDRSAVTQMAHIGVHIAQIGPDAFELSLFRGFAESFWEWLVEMSEEFGYEVR
jgi:methylglutamate dehydrogenase subunit D